MYKLKGANQINSVRRKRYSSRFAAFLVGKSRAVMPPWRRWPDDYKSRRDSSKSSTDRMACWPECSENWACWNIGELFRTMEHPCWLMKPGPSPHVIEPNGMAKSFAHPKLAVFAAEQKLKTSILRQGGSARVTVDYLTAHHSLFIVAAHLRVVISPAYTLESATVPQMMWYEKQCTRGVFLLSFTGVSAFQLIFACVDFKTLREGFPGVLFFLSVN